MKKLLIILILLLPFFGFAQDPGFIGGPEQKSFLSISGGISSPLGVFSRHNINDS